MATIVRGIILLASLAFSAFIILYGFSLAFRDYLKAKKEAKEKGAIK